jgi:predicted permease
MLASEVALALILVIGAGLLATSLVRLFSSGAGFNPKGVVNIALDMDKQSLDGDALMDFYRQFGETMSHQPGVTSVSFARMVPLTHTVWDDDHARPGGVAHDLYLNAVAPDYFKVMSIPMYEGRDFRWTDTPSTGLKMIINQSASKLFFPGRDPIGQHILRGKQKTDFEIVGVVGDTKIEDLRTAPPPGGYEPVTQLSADGDANNKKISLTMVICTSGAPSPLAGVVRSLAARLTPDIPAPEMKSMDDIVESSIGTERVMALLSVFFAVCALLVTGIGLYGTLAYATARRTSEIGIRIALGAQRAGVVALVFRANTMIAAVGSAIGFIVAILASRALASFLYETSPRDPWILIGSVAALAFIASAASILPAIRAARIEPITAIRCE